MGKYFGNIGYAVTKETVPGIWEEGVTEKEYYGDLIKNTSRKYESGEGLNDNITISNNISIVADAFAYENFSHIRYAEFMGARWIVTNVEVQHPRLILTLGGVYNGESPRTSDPVGDDSGD